MLSAHGGSFDDLRRLNIDHGGRELHYGAALALAAVTRAWSVATDTPPDELIDAYIS